MTGGQPKTPPGGHLAQVIATRGGKAEPEAPLVIEHREALIYMLCEAAELEHGIMCQYLFAAFSLKQGTEERLTADELEAVTRWRKVIAHVGTEEMLHLALVHNLLSAIGAAPHFSRPNLPAPARHYPGGVHLALVPFGEAALRHFMFLERPEGMQLHGAAELDAALAQAVPLMSEEDIVPRLQDFATVGHLYRSIENGIAHLAEKYGERRLFVGPPRAQATATHFGWPELVAVTDLASAQQAIDTILEQGEGARGDWRHAHFGQFVQILDEYQAMKTAKPEFEPTRPVLAAKVRLGERDEDTPLITDPVTARCTDLFNVGYEVLLQALERFFAHTEETDAQLATLADLTVGLMLRVLRPLGSLITTLPVGPERPSLTAGPSFELFYESDYLMPHREAAWVLLEERLRESAVFCDRIRGDCDREIASRLEPILMAINELADSLTSPAGPPEPAGAPAPASGPAPEQPDPAELARIAQAADALVRSHPPSDEAALSLRAEAHVRTLLENGDAQHAQRLVRSVLRPLAAALDARTAGDPEIAAPSDRATQSEPTSDSLWTIAQEATQLRVAHPESNELAEATACLQQLAIALGPEELATERLSELRQLQSSLERQIQVARDGPYLVTNARRLRDWLGEESEVTPQLALCRCGASQLKPFCDGSHAEVGFSGEKSPSRVPDQRDTYDGLQLTVYDNRGICQHSGFCTDRVNAVFHTEGTFVTPSGGRMDEIIRAVRDCPSGALSYAIDGVEAREQVDWHGRREAMIEVTKDGPYRATGAIPLIDHEGRPVPRARGASTEHYALCRCGQSQNKPFCSGMHWYVEFHDPVEDPDAAPTIFEWAGGLPALTRMTRLFYEKHVPEDPLLAPLFATMSPDHPERVAKWLGEVFCGPKAYSEKYGGYERMLSQHLGKAITEEQRARWVTLLMRSAREAALPNDPEFRSAFQAYLEWGSRLAFENSQPGARPPQQMPMPHWDWNTAAGPPGSRVSALAQQADGQHVELPRMDEQVSFDAHVKPMFRERDRRSMQFAFDLWSLDDVRANAQAILERVRAGTMPCDGAWPKERVDVFDRWVQSSMNP